MAEHDAPQSRNEAILQNILGESNILDAPQSSVEAILQSILYNTEYTEEPQSRIEKLLLNWKGAHYDLDDPTSNNERILHNIVGNEVEILPIQSRIEALLLEILENGVGEEYTVTGIAPLVLANALAKSIVSLKQYGKCEQADTPTPTAPQDIKCNNGTLKMIDSELPTGYKRLKDITFDGDVYYNTRERMTGEDDVTMTITPNGTTGQNLFGAYSGTGESARNFSLYIYGSNSSDAYFRFGTQLVRPNLGTGKRTITFGASGTDGFNRDKTVEAESFTSTVNAYIGALPNSTSNKFSGTIHGVITVGTRLKWIPCEQTADGKIGYYETVNGRFLEPQGTGTATTSGYDNSHLTLGVDGTPEVLSIEGKNIVNIDFPAVSYNGLTFTSANQVLSVSGTQSGTWILFSLMGYVAVASAAQARQAGSGVTRFKAGQAYTVKFADVGDIHGCIITSTDKNNYVSVPLTNGMATFTPAWDVSDLWVRFNTPGVKTVSTTVMVELGTTATDYEPYIEPQTASAENLFAVGNYADTQDIISGNVTRNVGIKVFDGTEAFTNTNGTARYALEGKQPKDKVLCTHFSGNVDANISTTNQPDLTVKPHTTTPYIYFKYTSMADIAAYQAYFAEQYAAGTPVIVVYPLAEPVVESVTAQPLNTSKGDNTINVIANVNDISIEAIYIKSKAGEQND